MKRITGLASVILAVWTWSAAGQAHADGPVEWLGRGGELPYEVGLEADARHCELFVDEFALAKQSKFGSRSDSLVVTLVTRAGDDVRNVGLVASVFESSSVRVGEPDEARFEGQRLLGVTDDFLLAYPGEFKGRSFVELALDWNEYQTDFGTRKLDSFAFFVDLFQDGTFKRLWLRAAQGSSFRDFVAADFAPSAFRYSDPVTWGYGSLEYLWRDSGSPLFDARSRCAR